MNQKGFVNILVIIAVIALVGAAGYYISTRKSELSAISERTILSFTIEPSTKVEGWIMYRDGTKAILKGKDLKSAEVKFFSTGTGITESSLAGKMNKVSESPEGDIWELKLQPYILATNFWAEAENLMGQKIKSTDLGSVGYEENKQNARLLSISEAKIASPAKGEKWIIGQKNTIRWNSLPDGVKEVVLSLEGFDDGFRVSYPLTIVSLGQYLDPKSTNFIWDTKKTYPAHDIVEVLPGTYKIILSFATKEGYRSSVESGYFNLVNP